MSTQLKGIVLAVIFSIPSTGCSDPVENRGENRSEFIEILKEFFNCRAMNNPNACMSEDQVGEAMETLLEDDVSFRGSCTAKCSDEISVTCTGDKCAAEDGVGCVGTKNGKTNSGTCGAPPKEDSPFGLPG